MSRYIDAEELKRIKFHPLPYTHITPSDVDAESYKRGWNDAIDTIVDCQPTADIRENVMGEWINTTSGEHYKCSQCGTLAPIWIDESNSCEYDKDISEWLSDFCPNCGADMRHQP